MLPDVTTITPHIAVYTHALGAQSTPATAANTHRKQLQLAAQAYGAPVHV